MANVSVFCGSSSGAHPRYSALAVDVGVALADGGHRLVYGGGKVGLMGTVADAVLSAGGAVTGVITEHLHGLEVGHDGLDDHPHVLEVTADMHERKARMAEQSDGVIVLPGGFGTLDETFEILTWNQLGIVAVPVVFCDVDGYFDGLFAYLERAVSSGFMKPEHGSLAWRASSATEAVDLATGPAASFTPKWVTERGSS